MQNINFMQINPPIQRKIICEGQNININYCSKKLFQVFAKVIQEKWEFFLREEQKQEGSILAKIQDRYKNLEVQVPESNNRKNACLPGLRKFKAFFESPSQEMIQKALACSSSQELMQLKQLNDTSVCTLVEGIEGGWINAAFTNPRIKFNYATASEARSTVRSIQKNQSLNQRNYQLNTKHWTLGEIPINVISAEFFYAFKNMGSLCCRNLSSLTSFPPEIYLAKKLWHLELESTGMTSIPLEICQISLSALTIKQKFLSIPEEILNHKTLQRVTSSDVSILYPFAQHSQVETFLISPYSTYNMQVQCDAGYGNKISIRGICKNKKGEIIPELMSWEKNTPLSCIQSDKWIGRVGEREDIEEIEFKVVKTAENGNNLIWEQGENRIYLIFDRHIIFLVPRF